MTSLLGHHREPDAIPANKAAARPRLAMARGLAAGSVGLGLMMVLLLFGMGRPSTASPEAFRPVGFQVVEAPEPGGGSVTAAVWYPTEDRALPSVLEPDVQALVRGSPIVGRALPLVIISHGSGGRPGEHLDTALALARAGFVVVAPLHTGDNYADQSAVGGPAWFIDRARDISAVIDFMLKAWPGHDRIDAGRIGVFGFSAGGFSALTAVGGEPDFRGVAAHCARSPEVACALWKPGTAPVPAPWTFGHEPRIKAAVVVAPGFGFTFAPDGLSKVNVPVQLWSGEADVNVPYAIDTALVREALGAKAEFHSVPGAGHPAFLAPKPLIGGIVLARGANGFDQMAFHRRFDTEVVRFFTAALKPNQS